MNLPQPFSEVAHTRITTLAITSFSWVLYSFAPRDDIKRIGVYRPHEIGLFRMQVKPFFPGYMRKLYKAGILTTETNYSPVITRIH
jgi:hypothetical protein